MRGERVYEEGEATLIPSGHGDEIHYRIFWGTVNWGERTNKAAVVFMQYGATRDWSKACALKEVAFHMPAHILAEDMAKVLEALGQYRP